jgi:hypothetical protein
VFRLLPRVDLTRGIRHLGVADCQHPSRSSQNGRRQKAAAHGPRLARR